MASSYDTIPDFGLLYDSVPLYAARADVGFYVDEAKAADGRVLEVGCGTGRILLPIARAGCAITGIDGSKQMLERCRVNLAAEPAAVQSRIKLAQHDMRDFSLAEQFALIIAPFRVVQHLTTVVVGANGVEREDTPEQRLSDGRTFRRTYRIARVRWIDQVSEAELVYYVDATRYVQAFEMRWYLAAELRHLLARAGFRVREMYGDFARGPVVDGCPEIVVVAEFTGFRV